MDTIIISLGGSIIVPNKIDSEFIREFTQVILELTKRKFRFVIVTGGGRTARDYQDALRLSRTVSNEEMDWIGIYATRLNAEFLKIMLGDKAHSNIIIDPTKKINTKKNIIIGAGWKPGFSTDYDSVILAKQYKANCIINLSNIQYVYDKDPNKFTTAKPITNISWADFREIVGDKWDPGLNVPFDPIAAKKAQKLGLKVVIMEGNDIGNLQNFLEEKDFIGTLIN